MHDTALYWSRPADEGGTSDIGSATIAGSGDTGLGSALPRDGTVFALSHAQQLLLWSARRWRHGHFQWSQVEVEFRRLLPNSWADALTAWETTLEQLHAYPDRWPDIGNGCRSFLSTDERVMLTLISVLQRQAPGWLSPAWLLARLLPPARRGDIVEPLQVLAAALSQAGMGLPLGQSHAGSGINQRSICK